MKNDGKTLLVLSPGFPKDEDDTTCLPSQQIFIRSLNKIYPKLNIIILSFQYPFSRISYSWYGNKIIPFNGVKKGIKARLRLWYQLWKVLRKLKKQNDVIGLLSFWCGECAFVGKYFGKRNRLKHLCWICGRDAKKGNKYIALMQPAPGELIAMSDFLSGEFYKNYGIRPSHVIPNAIEPALFPLQNSERNITILGVGSLIPLKQYDVFIDVVKEIRAELPPINIMLCGKGELENELQEKIASNHLQDIMILAGEKPHAETLRLMQRTKLFLHTSNYEGFSTVCLEALYAGCQVISFIKPMQHNQEHWHIVNSAAEMVSKAIEILKDPRTAYTRVMPYTMDDSASAIMNLFTYKDSATS